MKGHFDQNFTTYAPGYFSMLGLKKAAKFM